MTNGRAEDTFEVKAGAAPPYSRRLSDKILIAFHQACDQTDYDVANELLKILETLLKRPDPYRRRRSKDSLVAAHERLWHLRHPDQEQT